MAARHGLVGGLLLLLLVSAGCGDSDPAPQDAPGAAAKAPAPAAATSGVFINEHELSPGQVEQLVGIYRLPPPRGHFWYDGKNGLYGMWGREAAGYIRPGHDFGDMPENASNGHTGVFINGRQLNDVEVAFLQVLFNGQVQRGRVSMDSNWTVYSEGSPFPIANVALALQQAQRRAAGGGSSWSWRDGTGAAMASDGGCTMMAVPGAPVYGTSGC